MLIAAPFIKTKNWKPNTQKQENKLWYVRTIKYYSIKKDNKDKSQNYYTDKKKRDTKGYILCDTFHMKF